MYLYLYMYLNVMMVTQYVHVYVLALYSCDTGHLCALLSDVVNMFVSNLSRVWCNISRGEKMKTMLLVVASSGLSLSLSLSPPSLSLCMLCTG